MDEIRGLLDVAEATARHAGFLLFSGEDDGRQVDTQEHHDVKLRADKMSEALIIEQLRPTGLAILSEEAGLIGSSLQGLHWVVDPLDGTINYSRGIPLCCVSIGLWNDETPVCGVVYDPYREEMFSGIVGKGAWLNGEPLSVSRTLGKDQAILVSGFPARADLSEDSLRGFVENVKAYRKLRWLGSAALSLAYVGAGRADVYMEDNIMLWDIAGAAPVLLGAGGLFRAKKSFAQYSLNVFASNGRIIS